MGSLKPPTWKPVRIVFWLVALMLVGLVFGKSFVAAFRPPPGVLTDFVQEWLSGQNYRTGDPIYADQIESLRRHTGQVPNIAEQMLPRNAHPPVAVLFALPFVLADYPNSQLAWNLFSSVLFVLALVLVIRELKLPFIPLSLLPTATLILVCNPLYGQIIQGQLDFVLVFLISAAWVADRRGYQWWAGGLIGVAAAIKLFPAFLFLYFLSTGRWRAVLSGGVVVATLNLLTLSVFGVQTYRDYVLVVVPGLSFFQTMWWNCSPEGFWLRLFDPQPHAGIIPLVRSPELAQAFIWATRGVVVAIVAYLGYRAESRAARDKAFAAAVTALCLVSPIMWHHYMLLLLVPAGLLWRDLPPGLVRYAFFIVLALLWGPDNFITKLVLASKFDLPFYVNHGRLLDQVNHLLIVCIPVYLFVALFVFVLLVPVRESASAASEPVRPPDEGSEESAARLRRRLFGPVGGDPGVPAEPASGGK